MLEIQGNHNFAINNGSKMIMVFGKSSECSQPCRICVSLKTSRSILGWKKGMYVIAIK
jgi:hypothetical protein